MKTVYPDYYNDFKCIAEKCKHNCCIGWEIDIDETSLEFYKSVGGDFGQRLKDNISLKETAHFILKEDERCPFLNHCNLCDIYKELGENKLCQICSDHPRFYNELDGKTEAGLGLCCEEAARLIITKPDPVKLLGETLEESDGILQARSGIFGVLQNRSLSINQRVKEMLSFTSIGFFNPDILKWVEIFEDLERLDESWSFFLGKLKTGYETADFEGFNNFMKSRESEYEQLLCYLVYRHMAKSEFGEDIAVYSAFAALIYKLIYAMGAVIFSEKGDFTQDEQIELCRLFSSEIEYSDENLDIVLDNIEFEIFTD